MVIASTLGINKEDSISRTHGNASIGSIGYASDSIHIIAACARCAHLKQLPVEAPYPHIAVSVEP